MSQNFLERLQNNRNNQSYVRDCPVGSYDADPGWRRTEMIAFDRAPAHMLAPRNASPEMITGINFHSFFLTRESFDNETVWEPMEFMGKSKTTLAKNGGCREDYRAFKDENIGRTILSQATKKQFSGMRDSILNHKPTREIYDRAAPEVSCFFDLDGKDLPGKARIDLEKIVEEPILIDIKTTHSAEPGRNIQNIISNFKLFRQSAFYLDGYNSSLNTKASKFVLIFIEKEYPYMMNSVQMPDEWTEIGRKDNNVSKDNFKKWLDSGAQDTFYSPAIDTVEVPYWAKPDPEINLLTNR